MRKPSKETDPRILCPWCLEPLAVHSVALWSEHNARDIVKDLPKEEQEKLLTMFRKRLGKRTFKESLR